MRSYGLLIKVSGPEVRPWHVPGAGVLDAHGEVRGLRRQRGLIRRASRRRQGIDGREVRRPACRAGRVGRHVVRRHQHIRRCAERAVGVRGDDRVRRHGVVEQRRAVCGGAVRVVDAGGENVRDQVDLGGLRRCRDGDAGGAAGAADRMGRGGAGEAGRQVYEVGGKVGVGVDERLCAGEDVVGADRGEARREVQKLLKGRDAGRRNHLTHVDRGARADRRARTEWCKKDGGVVPIRGPCAHGVAAGRHQVDHRVGVGRCRALEVVSARSRAAGGLQSEGEAARAVVGRGGRGLEAGGGVWPAQTLEIKVDGSKRDRLVAAVDASSDAAGLCQRTALRGGRDHVRASSREDGSGRQKSEPAASKTRPAEQCVTIHCVASEVSGVGLKVGVNVGEVNLCKHPCGAKSMVHERVPWANVRQAQHISKALCKRG